MVLEAPSRPMLVIGRSFYEVVVTGDEITEGEIATGVITGLTERGITEEGWMVD